MANIGKPIRHSCNGHGISLYRLGGKIAPTDLVLDLLLHAGPSESQDFVEAITHCDRFMHGQTDPGERLKNLFVNLFEVTSLPDGFKVHDPVAKQTNPSDPLLQVARYLLASGGMGKDLCEQCAMVRNPQLICERAVEETVPISKVRFVNVADGHGCSRVGIDGRIGTTKRRDITREWALAFWRHPQQPHGILYRACNDPSRHCIVCFDRLGDVFAARCDETNVLIDQSRLAAILDEYEIGLDPS